MIYPYYCNLEKKECICEDRIKSGFCKRMNYECPHQKPNIFNLKEV